jgi:hypothetical protein
MTSLLRWNEVQLLTRDDVAARFGEMRVSDLAAEYTDRGGPDLGIGRRFRVAPKLPPAPSVCPRNMCSYMVVLPAGHAEDLQHESQRRDGRDFKLKIDLRS